MNVKAADAKAPTSIAALIAGLANVFKAIPSDKMEDMKDVIDLWNDPNGEHKNPGRGEIVTGPAESASGAGATKMIAEYSSPAKQEGMTAQYAQFQTMLDGWGKAFTDRLNAQLGPVIHRHDAALKGILETFAAAQKAQEATSAAPGADTFVGKALIRINKAKAAIRKADMADEDEREERKSLIAGAADLLKSAKRLLAKAEEEMEDTEDDAAEKAMTLFASVQKALKKAEKEDDDWEETEKAKQVAAQKAIDDAAAVTKKAEDDKKKEDEEAAEKAKTAGAGDGTVKAITPDDLKKALDGLATIPTTVQGLIDAVMGKSVNPVAPEITKGNVIDFDPAVRVQAAIDDDELTEDGITKAQSLVQHFALAKAGRLNMADVQEELRKASAEVRALFAPTAVAA